MTDDDILRMARKAGLFTHREVQPEIIRFAALVAAAEREDCAKLCEQVGEPNPDDPNSTLGEYYRDSVCYECAEAIRARSNK